MCGYCNEGETCDAGMCVPDMPCEPDCYGKDCGDDHCGGSCGSCGSGFMCDYDVCVPSEGCELDIDCGPGFTCDFGTCVPAMGDGACENIGDAQILLEHQYEVYGISASCGLECLGQEDGCATNCIVLALDISYPCASCFGDQVECTITHCIAQCVADQTAPDCLACQRDHCLAAFCGCAGFAASPDCMSLQG